MAVQREYLSPNEIAEVLGVSPFTIRRYIKLGQLKAVKLLGGFRVHRDDLQRFLKAHEVNSTEEQVSPEEEAAEQNVPEPALAKPKIAKPQPAASRGSSKTVPVSRRARRRGPEGKKLRTPRE